MKRHGLSDSMNVEYVFETAEPAVSRFTDWLRRKIAAWREPVRPAAILPTKHTEHPKI